ncbi:extensin family protein [Afipia carboxidovorans]|uniref:extensin-like domain-containing protein n=1 Tax=Afipia carboxidovorans TaxID=40137 RepID=UPI0030D32A28
MARGVSLFIVGSLALVSLAGCGRGFFQSAVREPWRAEAEQACLKSGEVKESADIVRINPISGPGVCGAQFPLKVAALGEMSSSLGYAGELRPPGSIAGAPRWPVSQPPSTYQQPQPSYARPAPSQGGYVPSGEPVPLNAQVPPDDEDAVAGEEYSQGSAGHAAAPYGRSMPPQQQYRGAQPPAPYTSHRLGSGRAVEAFGPVALKPAATLSCPVVSALDRWLSEAVQPAAVRWFGARVVEIKQISAYSCRGMNGNPNARISEHAFGNALDVAGFTLADGRYISVQNGWKGLPEEQGFLRDVQGAACQRFTTVLAPGANIYHYNHIHVDLMRRSSGRVICQPAAVSGEEIAARAGGRNFATRDPGVTGSIGQKARRASARGPLSQEDRDSIEDESRVR